MKKLLMVLMIFISGMFCYGFENSSAQLPQAQFQSVNTLTIGTNHQYNITPVGSHDMNGSQTPMHSPRRVGRDDDFEEPMTTPVGDPPIILILMLCFIFIYKYGNRDYGTRKTYKESI